jgi:crotonobetainyl-CoA:carnitine CoA-transferase CaiB-like acyl-CoA transferase
MTAQGNSGALDGIRILDATNLIAGPVATTILADFGADVVKIEHPKLGDPLRSHGEGKGEVHLWWTAMARNKRCITLDLHHERGQEMFRDMAAQCDVVIESFRPGTFERWGLGYDRLKEINPGIIFTRVTGFGQFGPMSERPGFGTLAESMAGFTFRNGQPDGPPTLPPLGLADTTAGMAAANATLMALLARERGAGGQVIDVSLIEPLLTILCPQEIIYDQLGLVLERIGSRSPMNAPRNVYRTLDDSWVAISTSTTATAKRLFTLMERPDVIAEPWFGEAYSRAAHVLEVDQIVGDWVGSRTRADALSLFEAAGVPAGPVYSAADILADEQYEALGSIARVPHPVLGEVRMPNVMYRMSKTPGSIRWAGPVEMGHDNAEVFGQLLNLSPADLEKLKEQDVI